MTLTTHVLDVSIGKPAPDVAIELFSVSQDARTSIARCTTNSDGRTDAPLGTDLAPGIYELTFAVAAYFEKNATRAFFDTIAIRFKLDATSPKCHVPLLLSPWGYSTYRGS